MSKALETEEEVVERNWLSRVHDIVKWQLIGPRAYNPFGQSLSTTVLRQLARDKDALLRVATLRGLIDGYEFVTFKDARSFSYESDHPYINRMSRKDFEEYFAEFDLYKWLDDELEKLQRSYQEELERRLEAESKSPNESKAPRAGETIAEIRARKQAEKEQSAMGDTAGDGAQSGHATRFYTGGSSNQSKK